MDFSESVKKEVKEKAAFKCCRCQSIGVEIHHIVPQARGGSAEIDNAAPLCPNCHAWFGANPEKQKEIRQMRDWWYYTVSITYPDNRQIQSLEAINFKLDQLQRNQVSLDDFKAEMYRYNQELYQQTNAMISGMTAGTAAASASGIVNASFAPSGSISPSASPSISPSASASPYDWPKKP
jgi:hypothetical protein